MNQYRKAAYCSFHTTAGYLEQAVCARLGYSHKQLAPLIRAVQKIFPHNAGYFHDRMQLRDELSESQKEEEPINGDSHLTFISAGLNNCVIYLHHPDEPVYFIELDGIYKHHLRQRRTTVMAYSDTEVVHRGRVEIPVSEGRAIEAFNLKDPRYGLFSQVADWSRQHGIEKGYVDIRLAPEEKHVGMTVNEYETLLMRNDLPQALIDPLRFALQRGNDVVQLYNYLMDQVPVGRSMIDRIFAALSTPAKRILRPQAPHPATGLRQCGGRVQPHSPRHLPKPDSGPIPPGPERRAPSEHRAAPLHLNRCGTLRRFHRNSP